MRVLVVTAMYPTKDDPARGTFVKEQVESLREAGADVDVFAFEGKGSARNYMDAGMTLRRISIQKQYDLIHAHYGLAGAAAVMQTNCPVIITFHGSDLLGEFGAQQKYTLAGKVKTYITRGAALLAAKRIVVAQHLKPKLWPKSAVTIPMGVDLSLFKPMPADEARQKLGFPPDKHLVLFVAHPDNSTKRFDIAQKAVSLLQEDHFNVELLPVFNLPHDQVPLYMNACNVLVLTSMHEASPCVIKEAMACNLPIVSVDVGDVAERIRGVGECHLCEREPQDVAAKLRLVLERSTRSNGRAKIAELSLANIASRVMAVYKEVYHPHTEGLF